MTIFDWYTNGIWHHGICLTTFIFVVILNTYCIMFLDLFLVPFPSSSHGKAQFISQIVKIAHKIQNCSYITSILSIHYFISFQAILTYHIQSSINGVLDEQSNFTFICVVGYCHFTAWSLSVWHPSPPTFSQATLPFYGMMSSPSVWC